MNWIGFLRIPEWQCRSRRSIKTRSIFFTPRSVFKDIMHVRRNKSAYLPTSGNGIFIHRNNTRREKTFFGSCAPVESQYFYVAKNIPVLATGVVRNRARVLFSNKYRRLPKAFPDLKFGLPRETRFGCDGKKKK